MQPSGKHVACIFTRCSEKAIAALFLPLRLKLAAIPAEKLALLHLLQNAPDAPVHGDGFVFEIAGLAAFVLVAKLQQARVGDAAPLASLALLEFVKELVKRGTACGDPLLTPGVDVSAVLAKVLPVIVSFLLLIHARTSLSVGVVGLS